MVALATIKRVKKRNRQKLNSLSKPNTWYWALALVVCTLLAYSNVYHNEFLLDDEFLIIKNQFLREWSSFFRLFYSSSTMGAGGVDSFYRPLQALLYMIVYQFFALDVMAYHFLNVVLHITNALLVWRVGLKLGVTPWAAGGAALLWALHPVHTEAVTYMSATADPLHTIFILAAVLVWPHWWKSLAFFILGLLSKESAIVLPALMIVVIWVQSRKPWAWRQYLSTWPLWATAAVYLLLRQTVLNFDETFQFYKEANLYTENWHYRLFTFLATLPEYFMLLVFPSGLHMERTFPVYAGISWPVTLGALMVALAALALWRERNRDVRALSFGFLWFAAAHIPHTGVLLPVNSFFLEHWMYLPSIGLFLGMFWWLSLKNLKPRLVMAATVCIAIALSVLTFRQNQVWRTPVSFYTHILGFNEGTGRVHNNLGMAYSALGRRDLAIQHYQLAIQLGYDKYPQVYHNIAIEFIGTQQLDAAEEYFLKALSINPRFIYTYEYLIKLYEFKGNAQKAEEYRQKLKDIQARP